MLQTAKQPVNKLKRIDQMLEDFAGEEMDEFDDGHSMYLSHQKHYCAEEEAILDIDELY